jgi:hypothetical protein
VIISTIYFPSDFQLIAMRFIPIILGTMAVVAMASPRDANEALQTLQRRVVYCACEQEGTCGCGCTHPCICVSGVSDSPLHRYRLLE